ncbi:HAMP domain-containing histidine kinase, partial [Klebsiella pneumoniae]|nr:HAMP domain-containing histidine kinase [Klebsiella pneumoniae]
MKDLAEFAKVDNGNIVVNNISFNLAKLIKDTVSECESISNKHSIDIIIVNISYSHILSYPFRIAQITENLVTNAIKYTDKGHITINAFLEGDRTLVIEVEDTGRGIPKDKLKSIFLPFIRVADGVKVPGFGMGLAIVMGVVKTMNGRISVKSELGLGSL